MKRLFAMIVAVSIGSGAQAAEPVVLEGLTSTKEHGVVKVQADPTLSEGRLVLEVVAFNRTPMPSEDQVWTERGAGDAGDGGAQWGAAWV